MEMARVWPIVCQFGIGAVLCALGTWAGIRSGYLDLGNPGDRRIVVVIVVGYVALLILSCLFTFWLPFVPAEAAP